MGPTILFRVGLLYSVAVINIQQGNFSRSTVEDIQSFRIRNEEKQRRSDPEYQDATTRKQRQIVTTSQHGQPIITSEGGQPATAYQHGQPVITSKNGQPVITSENGQPIIASEHVQPVITSENGQPVIISEHGQQVITSEGGQPITAYQHGQSIITSEHGQPVITSEHEQPVITSEHGQPVITSEHGQPVITSEHGQPVITSECEQPVITSEHGQPVITSEHEQPVMISEHGQPVITSEGGQPITAYQHGQPVITSKNGQPVITSEHGQPVITSEHGQPVITSEYEQPVITSAHEEPVIMNQRGQPVVARQHGQLVITSEQGQSVITHTEIQSSIYSDEVEILILCIKSIRHIHLVLFMQYFAACIHQFIKTTGIHGTNEGLLTTNLPTTTCNTMKGDCEFDFVEHKRLVENEFDENDNIFNLLPLYTEKTLIDLEYIDNIHGHVVTESSPGLCVTLTSRNAVFAKPLYEVCFLGHNSTDDKKTMKDEIAIACKIDVKNIQWDFSVKVLRSNFSCVKDPTVFLKLYVKWIGSQVSYVLSATSLCFCLYLFTNLGENAKFKGLFVVCNVIWILWRIQETLHENQQWRDNAPYVCIAMYYVQYLSQTMTLHLLSYVSLERLFAIISPFCYQHGKKARGHYKSIAVVIALLVGSVCSTLNLVAVLTMRDDRVKQTCHLAVSDSANEYLGFMVVAKITILLFVFILPCTILVYANVVTIIYLKKPTKDPINRTFSGDKSKKLNKNLSILLFSSLFILCCLAKPVLDTHMAVMVHYRGINAKRSVAEVISELCLPTLRLWPM